MEDKSGIGAKYTEGPKLRRGTAWSRNKCGLRRITAMRDADRARLRTKRCRRKTESELQKGPLIAEILEANWNEDRGLGR